MIRRLRLISGLVMLTYVTMHLLNHAVGLISLETMENVLWYVFRIWTNRPAQLLLYSSFLVHYALALYALWQRRILRLRASEMSQLMLGFAVPLLLVRHVVVTRISDSFFHTDVGYYAYLLWVYFVRSPDQGFVQMLVLVVAWGHAMIGLHFWLRVRPWYARLQSVAQSARCWSLSYRSRRHRSGSAGCRSGGRRELDQRTDDPALTGHSAHSRSDHRSAQWFFFRHGWGGIAGARRP